MVAVTILASCMPGPKVETMVDDLRILAMVADAPEITPGEAIALTVHVGEPANQPVDLLVWSCFNLGEGCLEAKSPDRYFVVEDVSLQASIEMASDASVLAFLTPELPEIPVAIWALACDPGVCPSIELALAGELEESFLENPTDSLKDLPFDGVSLAFRTVWLSDREEKERRTNPVITPNFKLPDQASSAENIELLFGVESNQESVQAYGYATAGGFGAPENPVLEGEVTPIWYPAPEEMEETAETVRFWVAVQDEEGGVAVWTDALAY
jgi:hypothetical protein